MQAPPPPLPDLTCKTCRQELHLMFRRSYGRAVLVEAYLMHPGGPQDHEPTAEPETLRAIAKAGAAEHRAEAKRLRRADKKRHATECAEEYDRMHERVQALATTGKVVIS